MSGEIDEDVMSEGCYYLSKLGLGPEAIAERFEISEAEAERYRDGFARRLLEGAASETASDLEFWKSVREEAEGNIKVTFVTGKGFHHAWRSDLEKLDGPTLLSIFESCKEFLNVDPNTRFLKYSPPKNYDPLAMEREISKAVTLIDSILKRKWKQERTPQRRGRTRKK